MNLAKLCDATMTFLYRACRGRYNQALPIPNRREILVTRTVMCVKLKREAEGLDVPPYPGAMGKRLYESVSKEAWKQWLELQKMLVNENRLNLADKKARDYLLEQMEKHFFGEGAELASGYVPPSK